LSGILSEGRSAGSGDALRPRDPRPGPSLPLILQQALMKVAEESGREEARKVAQQLRERQGEILRSVAGSTDREVRQRAIAAVELETAKVAVRILGPGVIERVIAVAVERVTALESRIAAAPAGTDTERAQRIVTLMKEEIAKARAALSANPPQALIHALNAAQGADRLMPRR
jgi:hypothetical protein